MTNRQLFQMGFGAVTSLAAEDDRGVCALPARSPEGRIEMHVAYIHPEDETATVEIYDHDDEMPEDLLHLFSIYE